MSEQDNLSFSGLTRESEILTQIQQTLSVDPNANQRTLAQNSNISLGMMNAVLKRCIERGWIAVKNLNMKKVCYCLTAQGFEEISRRSSSYMKRSFSMMNDYAGSIENLVSQAKSQGKSKVVLYGTSNIQFVIEWACQKNALELECHPAQTEVTLSQDSLNLCGESVEDSILKILLQKGCKSVCDVVE